MPGHQGYNTLKSFLVRSGLVKSGARERRGYLFSWGGYHNGSTRARRATSSNASVITTLCAVHPFISLYEKTTLCYWNQNQNQKCFIWPRYYIYIFHTMCLVYKWSGRLSLKSVNDRWQEGHPLENLPIQYIFSLCVYKNNIYLIKIER